MRRGVTQCGYLGDIFSDRCNSRRRYTFRRLSSFHLLERSNFVPAGPAALYDRNIVCSIIAELSFFFLIFEPYNFYSNMCLTVKLMFDSNHFFFLQRVTLIKSGIGWSQFKIARRLTIEFW